ncbi:hypothetical protein K440DRAFT_642268 [Wilcoxina mikolae CBS 423.85]|nr:hypothetical protein K440DRAFT_642268 [Wilcoxina mikolae CBS 423.85]
MRPFIVYIAIIVTFAPPPQMLPLAFALITYQHTLYDLLRTHAWDSVRKFHIVFHQKRICLLVGVYEPAGWSTQDHGLETAQLFKRSATDVTRELPVQRQYILTSSPPRGPTTNQTNNSRGEICNNLNKETCNWHVIFFGALIGYTGPLQFILGTNLPSALNNPAAITNDVLKRATAGQILRLTTLPDRFIACSIGLAPKPEGTGRRIHHVLSPSSHSVNVHILQTWGTLTYTQFDDAVAAIQTCGPRAVLVKRDLTDAFRHIHVHPDN